MAPHFARKQCEPFVANFRTIESADLEAQEVFRFQQLRQHDFPSNAEYVA